MMDSDNEGYHCKSEFYYRDEDFRHFRTFHSVLVEKNKHVICRSRSVRIGKNCALCLEYGLRPAATYLINN